MACMWRFTTDIFTNIGSEPRLAYIFQVRPSY